MDRLTKQKISKETQTLNDEMDQLDLIDIYKTFHPKAMNFTFFSSEHRTFSRIDHILGHKYSLGKFRKIEIISSIFSDQNVVKLDVNYGKKTIKNTNIWRLNNTLLNNQQITEEIKKEIKICLEMNEKENTTTQNLWDSVKAVLRGRFIAIQAYLKKQEKNQINNRTLHPTWASLVAQRLKRLPAMRETWVRTLGWEDPLEKEMATHSSILAWRTPWTAAYQAPPSMGFSRQKYWSGVSLPTPPSNPGVLQFFFF